MEYLRRTRDNEIGRFLRMVSNLGAMSRRVIALCTVHITLIAVAGKNIRVLA